VSAPKRQRAAAPQRPPERRARPWTAPAIVAALVLIFYWVPLTSSSASIQWDAADMHYPLQK
jgi:hypothetical protein